MKKILLILLLPITVIAQSNHAKLLSQFMTDQQQYFNFNGTSRLCDEVY